jgi:hypothetical protein
MVSEVIITGMGKYHLDNELVIITGVYDPPPP